MLVFKTSNSGFGLDSLRMISMNWLVGSLVSHTLPESHRCNGNRSTESTEKHGKHEGTCVASAIRCKLRVS